MSGGKTSAVFGDDRARARAQALSLAKSRLKNAGLCVERDGGRYSVVADVRPVLVRDLDLDGLAQFAADRGWKRPASDRVELPSGAVLSVEWRWGGGGREGAR